jgi:transcriptional regulator with XRE-family HTH domain
MQGPDALSAAVGRNVRAARQRRGWTLDVLANRSSVSNGMSSPSNKAGQIP